MAKLTLSPPWITFANEMKAMFDNDDQVSVVFDQEESVISVYVEGQNKAEALEQLLVKEAVFGTVTVKVKVIPGNTPDNKYVDLYKTAFQGNCNYRGSTFVSGPLGKFTYIVWSCVPKQFFDDNLADYQGNRTLLLEDIAKDIFAEADGVYHCTTNC